MIYSHWCKKKPIFGCTLSKIISIYNCPSIKYKTKALNFNIAIRPERLVLSLKNIPKLIAQTFCLPDHLVDVTMAMSIDPIVYITILNIVRKLDCKCTIDRAALKFRRHQLIRRNMVSDDDLR